MAGVWLSANHLLPSAKLLIRNFPSNGNTARREQRTVKIEEIWVVGEYTYTSFYISFNRGSRQPSSSYLILERIDHVAH